MSSWLPRCGSRACLRPDEADAVESCTSRHSWRTRRQSYYRVVVHHPPRFVARTSASPLPETIQLTRRTACPRFADSVGIVACAAPALPQKPMLWQSDNGGEQHDVDDGNDNDSARSSGLH